MDETCSIDVQVVKGAKNILLGGEGIFNTVITGPGKVTVHTMPIARLADSIIPFLPTNTNNNGDAASSIIGMFNK